MTICRPDDLTESFGAGYCFISLSMAFHLSVFTSDVVRPGRLTGLRDFIEMALGLFEAADTLRALLLSRTSSEWPCDRHSNNRNEIASLHSSL